jgi:hypothetical protein
MRRIKQLLTMHFGAGASTRAIGRELGSADFAKRANGQGSKIEALIEPQVPQGRPGRPGSIRGRAPGLGPPCSALDRPQPLQGLFQDLVSKA